MRLADLKAARMKPYAAVAFCLTGRCVAKCRHCSVRAGWNGTSAADPVNIERWIRSIGEVASVEVIGITGGEPFIEEQALCAALSRAQQTGVLTVVYTSAYWAESESAARNVLARLPHIDLLEISTDVFHEEFVPLSNVAFAAAAALEAGTGVWLQINKFQSQEFSARLRKAVGQAIIDAVDLSYAPLLKVGRAADLKLGGPDRYTKELPVSRCDMLTSPLVRPDGSVLACCSEEVYSEPKASSLHLGSLNQKRFADIIRLACDNPLFLAFRTFGPAYVAEIARGLGWSCGVYREGNICDLCRHLLADPDLVFKLTALFSLPDQRRLATLAAEYLEAASELPK